jgi:hypothetical protein
VPDDPVPDEVPTEELPVDVSVGESGVEVGTDAGISVDVSTENGPGVDVGTPPLPPTPTLPRP